MPKMKSRSCAKKRAAMTANGHVKRSKAGKRHYLNSSLKSRKTKRKLRQGALIFKGFEKKFRAMIDV